MNATDKLQRMLNERGVEYSDFSSATKNGKAIFKTRWKHEGGYAELSEWESTGRNSLFIQNVDPEQAIAATLGNDGVNEGSIDKWLREFHLAHGELVHIGPDELKDLAFALHDDIPLGYEASLRLGQWLLSAALGMVGSKAGSKVCDGKLTAEQVRRCVRVGACDHGLWEAIDEDTDWQAIADELNVAMGGGECEVECFDDGVDEGMDGEWFSYAPPTWYLSCGHTAEGSECPPSCPACGKAVKR